MNETKSYATLAAYALSDDPNKPIQILRTGDWYFKDIGQSLNVTTQDLHDYATNFQKNVRRQKIPVNIEHVHELGAVGAVKDVFVTTDGEKLMAVMDWTKKGEELVKDNAFLYTSSEILTQYSDAESGESYKNVLSGVALTNYPRIKDMASLAASEPGRSALIDLDDELFQVPLSEIFLGHTRSKNAMDPKADAKDQKKPDDGTQHKKADANDGDEDDTSTQKMTDKKDTKNMSENSYILHELAEMREKFANQESQLAEVKNKNKVLEQNLEVERQTRIMIECNEHLDRAKRQGKITPEQLKNYSESLPKMNDDQRKLWIEDIEQRVAVIPLGELGSGSQILETQNSEQTRIMLSEKARQIMDAALEKGQKMTFNAALLKANQEITKGAK